jgi:hypothetical protein
MKPTSARGDWVKQLRFDMMFAEKTLLKSGEVSTMVVVHAKGEKHVIAAPWHNDEEKAALLEMINAYCIAHEAEALTYISEAWVRYVQKAPGETEAEYQARKEVRPRDAEDRREVVIVMIMYRDDGGERQVVSDTKEIVRRANGKPDGLKPYRLNGGMDVLGGAIVEAFPEWPPSSAERIAAEAILKVFGMIER